MVRSLIVGGTKGLGRAIAKRSLADKQQVIVCARDVGDAMMKQVRPLAKKPGRPYHLVVVSSTSAWRVRQGESVYASLCAAKSHFVRQFARELVRDLPGSKVTLVHPGGMNNPHFWSGTGRDTSAFMDADTVASLIYLRAMHQEVAYDEYSIMRDTVGKPKITDGPRQPEEPF
jgi:NAD(P)-dependent dehydrogenase (short-subunit alcohol dehydrogenase family)